MQVNTVKKMKKKNEKER